jgi:hypothetical protein
VLARRDGAPTTTAPSLRAIAPKVPTPVADAIMRAIDPSPAGRPSAEALAAVLASEPTLDDARAG